jgi:hypothetical protein
MANYDTLAKIHENLALPHAWSYRMRAIPYGGMGEQSLIG